MSDELFEPLTPWLAELVLVAGAALMLVLARLRSHAERAGEIALLVAAASAVGAVASMDALQRSAAGGLVSIDPFAAFFKFVLSMSALSVAWLSTRARETAEYDAAPPLSWAAFLLS